MKSFKTFLTETAADSALKIIKDEFGEVSELGDFDDSILDTAKEQSTKIVNAGIGKWVVSFFVNQGKKFARIVAPKGANLEPRYFIQA